MWVAGHVRVHGDGEDEVVVFAVEVVEVVAPELLDRLGVDPAVGLVGAFDEHLLFGQKCGFLWYGAGSCGWGLDSVAGQATGKGG